ncbi:rhomboid-related protein 2-like [Musca autumnalis]|uniref:rhomboid-related protein 2-like n=1 Tax=Musca autumnalis TaxID=221902 RepID=UPI003CF4905D
MSTQSQQGVKNSLSSPTRQGTVDLEEIPLHEIPKQEPEDRCKIRDFFERHDADADGKISIHELKALIAADLCGDIPHNVTQQILKMSDNDNNGYLDFEEFYAMSKRHKWTIHNLLASYCRMFVPPPKALENDQVDGLYEEQMSICPPPLTMVIISLVEIIMFLIDVIHFQVDPGNANGPAATIFVYNPYKRYQSWRFVTYMFVHVSLTHILMNLFVQICLGVVLELVHHWRVGLVYLAGVVAGSMGTSLTSPGIFLAGASGGVYALITAHIGTIIVNWNEMEYALVQLFVLLFYCFADLGTSIYRHITDQHDQIGYVAHLSGAIAGFLMGICVLRNLEVRRWERILWWLAFVVMFVLMMTGTLIHILLPDYFPPQE